MTAGSIALCRRFPKTDASPFRAVAMGPNLPLTLRGSAPAIALPDVKQFRVFAQSPAVEGGFEALYAQTVDQALRGTGTETFEAIDMLRKADPSRFQPENGADYPRNRVGQTLQQVAQLHKADIGLEVTFVDTGGWDNHVNEGGAQGQLGESAARSGAVAGGVFTGYGRPHGRYRGGHHV